MLFAHMSDIHLGFQKQENLQKIEQQVFDNALDECIKRKVDFILIPGDLFHVNIPEMRVQKFAFAKFRQVHENKIPVYVVYGSHDFSPVSNSVIDLLSETGYITKVTKVKESTEDKITLDFVVDPKTGTKIAGLPGLKVGKDEVYYQKLDRVALESEPGFKIFLFHGGIDELKLESGPETDFMALSLLPKGFDYYAGGHMHGFLHQKYAEYSNVVYPGTLFSGWPGDLEENAKGKKRGMVFVEFEDKIKNIEFYPMDNTEYEIIEIDASKKSSANVNSELLDRVRSLEPENKIIIIKIEGELSEGKTTDIEFTKVKEELQQKLALDIQIKRNQMTSKEYTITQANGKDKNEIESNIFSENIGEVRTEEKELTGNNGVQIAKRLLKEITQSILVNEKKAEYNKRIEESVVEILGLKVEE
ncbi:MAG TPA: DNA repair exonuclease [Candidatus Nitrosotalea sp.]|nr:DNA repair exonuclease [Candidatus Nitrosotalea sp.]